METAERKKVLNLKEIRKLHPLERQRLLKDLLQIEKDPGLIKLIKEEIREAELEERHVKNLEKVPEKEEVPTNLGALVEKLAETEEAKKPMEKVSGRIYGHEEEAYKAMGYSGVEQLKVEITSMSSSGVTTSTGDQNLSKDPNLKKLEDLYKKKKQEEKESGY